MRVPYGPISTDEVTTKLAREIVKLLASSGLTYQKATETLDAAQDMLYKQTKPSLD